MGNQSDKTEHEERNMVQTGYRYALSLSQHHYDAEDLVQQAWMKCIYKYGKVKTNLSFTQRFGTSFTTSAEGRKLLILKVLVINQLLHSVKILLILRIKWILKTHYRN